MATHYKPHIVTDGLVLYLDATNSKSYLSGATTWNDLSGKENNSSLNSTAPYVKGGIYFDGTTSYGEISQNTNHISSNPMTIDIWLYPTYFPGSGGIILMDRPTYIDSYGIQYFTLDSYGVIAIRGTSSTMATSISRLALNRWNNLVTVCNGTNVNMYFDGISSTITGQIETITESSYNMNITRYPTSPGNYNFYGSIDSIKIYNRALSVKEILQNYNAIKGRFNL